MSTDAALNEAIAEAMGYGHFAGSNGSMDCPICTPAEYHRSLDALSPVEARLREAGCLHVIRDWRAKGARTVYSEWRISVEVVVAANAPTEARARAEAALMALQALNSPTKEIAND